MIYTLVTVVIFGGILAVMWRHFRSAVAGERQTFRRKLRVADNKLKLLQMVSNDLGMVTQRLTSEFNGGNEAAPAPTGGADQKRALKAAVGGFDATISMASRIYDDMNTLLSIWNDDFSRKNVEIDLVMNIRRNISAFSDYMRRSKRKVKITFDEKGSWRCVVDPNHLSRCLRAMLAQAIKQTEEGEILVRMVVSDPVLTRKSTVIILVTDNSERPESDARTYDVVPDRVHRNPFLCEDQSATVRLNVAQHTAIKLGGRLTFHPHSAGNMTFKLSFTAEPVTATANAETPKGAAS